MNSEQAHNKEEAQVDVNTEEINDHESDRIPLPAKTDLNTDDLAIPASEPPDPIEYIKNMLESKSAAKQTTFRHLTEAFQLLCSESLRVINELKMKAHPGQEVTLYFKNISKHEFHVKLAGDLLIFVMHTNIITFEHEHEAMKDPYIKQNEVNRYFGQINVYNFMYDSLRYNRGNDPGYLIGRLMINHENRFFMEGEQPFVDEFGEISREAITNTDLQNIVKKSLQVAIKNDLVSPPYARVRTITLNQKNEHSIELGGGQKIGFQMSYQDLPEG
jgi:hypothetical protein